MDDPLPDSWKCGGRTRSDTTNQRWSEQWSQNVGVLNISPPCASASAHNVSMNSGNNHGHRHQNEPVAKKSKEEVPAKELTPSISIPSTARTASFPKTKPKVLTRKKASPDEKSSGADTSSSNSTTTE